MTQDSYQDKMLQELWRAAEQGNCSKIRMLAIKGVDLECRNAKDMNAFHIATFHSQAKAATTILAMKEAQRLRKMGMTEDVVSKFGKSIFAHRKHG